jgi:4-amino-4-deoxy-L-arabinose transferase-like glycosyltransferase
VTRQEALPRNGVAGASREPDRSEDPCLPRRAERAALSAILLLYLAIGSLYATRVPPYNAPDEPAHANYARDLAAGRWPVLQAGDWDAALLERLKSTRFPPGSDVSPIRYESHQPPLYYLLIAPVARLSAGLGERGQLVAMRLGTLVIGAAALLGIYACARLLQPRDRATALLAVALAAFVPMHVAVGASVSNDSLAELALSLVLWRCLLAQRDGLTGRGAAGLGLAVGVGLLTKLSCLVGLPLAAAAILLAARGSGDRRPGGFFGPALRRAAVAAGVALLVALPGLVRGALVYGPTDPLGLARHDQVVAGQPLTGALTAGALAHHAGTLFRSFWGQFGWMGALMDERVYLLLGFLTVGVGLGLLLWLSPRGGWAELSGRERAGFALAGLLVLGVLLGTVGYNLTYLQPQGRYLFPAMAGIASLAAVGLRELIAPRHRRAVYLLAGLGMAGLDVLALYRFVVPALAS